MLQLGQISRLFRARDEARATYILQTGERVTDAELSRQCAQLAGSSHAVFPDTMRSISQRRTTREPGEQEARLLTQRQTLSLNHLAHIAREDTRTVESSSVDILSRV